MSTPPSIDEIACPGGLLIASYLPGAHFYDSYRIPYAHSGHSALAVALRLLGAAPPWVDSLMRLRNRLVQLVGLKDLGNLNDLAERHPDSYQEGQRIGIFSLLRKTPREVILTDSDRHLDVFVSFALGERNGQPVLVNTTVVHTHNRLGRFYMWVVKPFHRRIVRSVLRRGLLAQQNADA